MMEKPTERDAKEKAMSSVESMAFSF